MKHRLVIVGVIGILGLSVLSSCRPKNILPPAEMEDIFYDLHYTEGVLLEAGYASGFNEHVRAAYCVVLEKHHVTQAQFDSSLVWYTDHPLRFDKIYPRILERLQAEREAINQAEQTLQTGGVVLP